MARYACSVARSTRRFLAMANPYISKKTYEEYLDEAAKKATESEVKILHDVHGLDLDDDARKKKYEGYLARLKKWKSFDDITREDLISVKEYDADSLRGWLNNIRGYRSPTEYAASKEAEKYMSLLKGVAEDGQDWYTMGSQQLKEEANRLGLGFDFRNKNAFADLLKRLQDYQLQYDRAQLLKQFQDSGANYWMAKLFYPSMTQEIENAIATGEGGDEETLKNLGRLDAGTNLAMALAPGLSVAKVNPTMMGLIDAGLQGVAEAGRQYGKEAISKTGQEADLGQAVLATTFGASRPALAAGAAAHSTSNIPGQFAKDVSRGMVRGARTGDPAKMEGERIANAIKLYNDDLAPKMQAMKEGTFKGYRLLPDTKGKYNDAVKVPKMAEIFGVKPNPDGTYDAKTILAYYRTPARGNYNVNLETGARELYPKTISPNENTVKVLDEYYNGVGPINATKSLVRKLYGPKQPAVELGADYYDTYKRLFPMASEGFDANRAAFGLGRAIGAVASDVGSRGEPIIKANPWTIYKDKNALKQYTDSYKDESWFKKLKNANPSAAKVLEEAMKKKEEEE